MQTLSFDYRIGWPARQRRQGEHLADVTGEAGAYRGDRLLRDAADVRHLALRASVSDPFGRLWSRQYLHSTTIDLWVLVDVSASMSCSGAAMSPLTLAAGLIESAALSARRLGDRLGVFCAASMPVPSLCVPASRLMGPALGVAGHLESAAAQTAGPLPAPAQANSAGGLRAAAAHIGRRQALVFLVSDFNDEACNWDEVLRGFAHHQVVPVVAWDLAAVRVGKARGLVSVRDAESGRSRVLWMRAGLRRKINARLLAHHRGLNTMFAAHGLRPLHAYEGFDSVAMTRYFHGVNDRRELP